MRIMVAPRNWTRLRKGLYVFFEGVHNTWVDYVDGAYSVTEYGAKGKWGIHRGTARDLPHSWDQVTEVKHVR